MKINSYVLMDQLKSCAGDLGQYRDLYIKYQDSRAAVMTIGRQVDLDYGRDLIPLDDYDKLCRIQTEIFTAKQWAEL